jgi:hypothetical protein
LQTWSFWFTLSPPKKTPKPNFFIKFALWGWVDWCSLRPAVSTEQRLLLLTTQLKKLENVPMCSLAVNVYYVLK